jgi:predicted hydrocarbon binding protein
MTQLTAEARFVRLPADAILAFRDILAEGRDGTEAAHLLRQAGYRIGEPLFRSLERWSEERHGSSPSSVAAEPFWETLSGFFADLGWGTLRHADLHPGAAALDSDDWVEASGNATSASPACHLTTGILADLLRRLAVQDVAVLEVECRSRGDERCRFIFAAPQVLEAVFEGMRDGRHYSEVLRELQ